VKLFSSKNFTLSLNEAPKDRFTKRRALFCFLLLIQSSAVQQKSSRSTLPNNKTFSTVKLALCMQSLCLLVHNIFLVFNISDNCWKNSHNLLMLPNHNSRVTLGFRFPSMLQLVHPIFYRPVLRTPNVLGNYRKVFPLRWRINHFALNVLSWVGLIII